LNDSKVAAVKTGVYDRNEVYNGILKIFDAFGGAARFFKSGDKVLVKPNLLCARPSGAHVTTHPEVVLSVCRILKDCGCRVTIGDSPGYSSAVTVAKKCGVYDGAKKMGIEIVNFEKNAVLKVNVPGRIFKTFEVAREIIDADKVVNLAKLKSHGQMVLTMSVKNMFGAIAGLLKPQWHFKAGVDAAFFARMLIELNLAIAPVFSILDGIYGMHGNGPSNGTPRKLGILAGGTNCVAIDSAAATLLKIPVERFYTGREALNMKLYGARPEEIDMCVDRFEDFDIDGFELPRKIENIQWPIFDTLRKALRKFSLSEPFYDRDKCVFCKICHDICPAGAINYKAGEKVEFDLNKCVRCFCCQELCPRGAITVKKSAFDRAREFLYK